MVTTAALAAFLIGRIILRHGRLLGIAIGFTSCGLGAIGVVAAATTGSIVLLFVALFGYDTGTATNLQARYAGTDLARPAARGTAISVAMVATTFGAVTGPNLVQPLGSLARAVGVLALAGPSCWPPSPIWGGRGAVCAAASGPVHRGAPPGAFWPRRRHSGPGCAADRDRRGGGRDGHGAEPGLDDRDGLGPFGEVGVLPSGVGSGRPASCTDGHTDEMLALARATSRRSHCLRSGLT